MAQPASESPTAVNNAAGPKISTRGMAMDTVTIQNLLSRQYNTEQN